MTKPNQETDYRTITRDELKKILSDHAEWLKDQGKGQRANLSYANLSYADLCYANLSYANLSYADLSYANLSYANLSYADLSYANLCFANLRYADLRSADLRHANLSYADLSYANLSYANLSYADLCYANLSHANLCYADLRSADLRHADLLIFQFQRHTAYFTLDGLLRIGCHVLPVTEWIEGYREIASKEGCSEAQIEAYGDFIRLCLKQFELAAKRNGGSDAQE